VLPRGTGQLFTAVDNVTPFWTLYAPTNEEDPRGLVGDVCAALGLPEPGIGGATITGAYLASRVERYLIQHPYVQTLVINAFNAGRGSVLADMLLVLQGRSAFADLRYDLRLFVPDPDAPGVGEALSELLSPSSSVTGKEADAFSAMGENHLYPKLGLAIRSIAEFVENPQRHMAHLTFLFDVFPAKKVSAARGEEPVGTAPVHGLFQDFCVDYTENEHTVAWQRRPQHGLAIERPEAEELTDLLTSLPFLLSTAVASVATGQAGLKRVPVITLTLEAQDRSLIHHVHEVSDWVITVDRNMGIEFFDHGGKPGRPDYLIDHSPDMTSDFGHRLFITSRLLQELQMMLEPALIQYGLPADQEHATVLLHQIRSLAGRLALKLISSPTQRAEVLGLALARLYFDYQGVLKNHILVPLDAHLELYHVVESYAEELQDEVSFKRTDLALFDLDTAARTITCRLVEVKCYSGAGDLSAYNQLKSRIAEQIAQSEQVLAHHFDPHRTPKDRPDRLIKTREFVTLLAFYLARSLRYQLFDTDAAREHRHDLSLVTIRQGIDNSRLPDHLKDLAHQRLDLAAEYIDDTTHLGDVIRPGRLVIVDLRDEFIEKDEALGLFVVLLQLFADVRYAGELFNKLVVFDEAHKYIGSPDVVASLIEVVREMRHKGTSIMVASQDPPSVPVSLIELSSQIILHKFNSPAWLKHIQKANAALAALTPEKMANLSAGEAYTWSSNATDKAFSKGVMKIRCRPRVTRHGGGTKTAVPHE
jgi:hypothetical protein